MQNNKNNTQDAVQSIMAHLSYAPGQNPTPQKSLRTTPLNTFAPAPVSYEFQDATITKNPPLSLWDKTKNFLSTGPGRTLLASGLTGAVTAATGGDALEALSYGARAGGTASEIYRRNLKDQDRLIQEQNRLNQRAFDNEQNRDLKAQYMQSNAELRKTLADERYEQALALAGLKHDQALDLAEQKNAYNVSTDERRRGWDEQDRDLSREQALEDNNLSFAHSLGMAELKNAYQAQTDERRRDWAVQDRNLNRSYALEDRDLDYERQNALSDKAFNQRQEMAGLNHAYDMEKMQAKLNDQMKMAVLNGDIEQATILYRIGQQFEKDVRLAQEKAALEAGQPTNRIKNYEYFYKNKHLGGQ